MFFLLDDHCGSPDSVGTEHLKQWRVEQHRNKTLRLWSVFSSLVNRESKLLKWNQIPFPSWKYEAYIEPDMSIRQMISLFSSHSPSLFFCLSVLQIFLVILQISRCKYNILPHRWHMFYFEKPKLYLGLLCSESLWCNLTTASRGGR